LLLCSTVAGNMAMGFCSCPKIKNNTAADARLKSIDENLRRKLWDYLEDFEKISKSLRFSHSVSNCTRKSHSVSNCMRFSHSVSNCMRFSQRGSDKLTIARRLTGLRTGSSPSRRSGASSHLATTACHWVEEKIPDLPGISC
jgi:hypothetical protein